MLKNCGRRFCGSWTRIWNDKRELIKGGWAVANDWSDCARAWARLRGIGGWAEQAAGGFAGFAGRSVGIQEKFAADGGSLRKGGVVFVCADAGFEGSDDSGGDHCNWVVDCCGRIFLGGGDEEARKPKVALFFVVNEPTPTDRHTPHPALSPLRGEGIKSNRPDKDFARAGGYVN